MQSVSRQIEVARIAGCIQVCQSEGDSVQLVGGYPAGVASLIKSLQSSMAKRSNHDKTIPRAGTAINRISDLAHTDAVDSDKSLLRVVPLDTWPSQTDNCSTPSAGRRSSTRRSWRSFSTSRTPRSTASWQTCWPKGSRQTRSSILRRWKVSSLPVPAASYSTPTASNSTVHENRTLFCRLTDKERPFNPIQHQVT